MWPWCVFVFFRNYVFQKRFVKFDGKNLMYFGSEKVLRSLWCCRHPRGTSLEFLIPQVRGVGHSAPCIQPVRLRVPNVTVTPTGSGGWALVSILSLSSWTFQSFIDPSSGKTKKRKHCYHQSLSPCWPHSLDSSPLTCSLFQDAYPKGVIPLAAIQMARPAKDNKFEIVTSHRIFVFRTDNEGKHTTSDSLIFLFLL